MPVMCVTVGRVRCFVGVGVFKAIGNNKNRLLGGFSLEALYRKQVMTENTLKKQETILLYIKYIYVQN